MAAEASPKFRAIMELMTTSPRMLPEKLNEISTACAECGDVTIPFMSIDRLIFSAEFRPERTISIAKWSGKPERKLLEDIVALPMFQGILLIDEAAQELMFAESFSVKERQELSLLVAKNTGGMS